MDIIKSWQDTGKGVNVGILFRNLSNNKYGHTVRLLHWSKKK